MIFPSINGNYKRLDKELILQDTFYLIRNDFSMDSFAAFSERLNVEFASVTCGGLKASYDENGILECSMGIGLVILKKEDIVAEGYRLVVTEKGIMAEASDEQGAIYALTSAYLLIEGNTIPCVEIEDAPKYRHRGISLDVSRHFFDAEEVMKIIEQLSLAKMNVLHWHLSDDQGWRIESKVFPKLCQTGQPYYKQEEIREIVRYAKACGVEVIPEIDMPGHTRAILAAYPELGCTGKPIPVAQKGGIYADILCAGKEKTYEFLEKLFEEICPLFPSNRFHIGGDEAPYKRWKECPDCNRRMKELGITEYSDLQGEFTIAAAALLQKQGKSVVCWNEVLNAKRLPESYQIQYWTPEGEETVHAYAKKGGEFIYANMYELYLDYPYSMTPVEKIRKIRPMLGGKPIDTYPGMLGYESPLWSEQLITGADVEMRLFPRVYAVAQLAWGGEELAECDFYEGLRKLCKLAESFGIKCQPEDKWNPEGPQRLQEALTFMKGMYDGPNENEEPKEPGPVVLDDWLKFYIRMFFREEDTPVIMKAIEEAQKETRV